MEHKIEFDGECEDCDGTGKVRQVIKFRDFEGKKALDGVERVLEANPGIGLGIDKKRGLTLESFGGMPYREWLEGQPFPPKSEMRQFTCPAWWYQSANYNRKPDWDWCRPRGFFSSCIHFQHKEKCWERFDKENL